ncbi:hypothetical protein GR7B_00078 [Vibrio phage vB_VcorM_GR7B]|nr:hypothetical protein GR7B_00078 [Vibrio phage vB_VcorM_GR7B]
MKKKKLAEAVEATLDDERELATAASFTDSAIDAPEGYDEFYDYVSSNFADIVYLAYVAAQSALYDNLSNTPDVIAEYYKKNFTNHEQLIKDMKSNHFGEANTVNLVPNEDKWDTQFEQLGAKINNLMISRQGRGFTMDIPCSVNLPILQGIDGMYQSLGYANSRPRLMGISYLDQEPLLKQQRMAFAKQMSKLTGGALGDFSKPIDFTLPVSKDLLLNSRFVDAAGILTDYDDEDIDMYLSFIKGIRFTATALPARIIEGYNYSGFVEIPMPDGKNVIPTSVEEINAMAHISDEIKKEYVDNFLDKSIISATNARQNFAAFVQVEIPAEISEYLVQTKAKEINPVDIHAWATAIFNHSMNGTEEIEIVNPLTNVRRITQEMVQRPRINEERLAVNPDGNVVFIPQFDNIEEYYSLMQDALQDGDEEEWVMRSPFTLATNARSVGEPMPTEDAPRKKLAKKPANKLLYLDWALNKMSYTNTDGEVSILDLANYRKANAFGIRKILESKVEEDVNVKMFGYMRTVLQKSGKSLGEFADESEFDMLYFYENDEAKEQSVKWLRRYLDNSNFELFIERVSNNAREALGQNPPQQYIEALETLTSSDLLQLRDLAPNSNLVPLRCIGRAFDFINDKVLEDLDDVFESRSVVAGMMGIARITVCAKYTPRYAEVLEQDKSERSAYQASIDIDSNYKPQPIPFLFDGYAYLPHQVRADAELNRDPENGVLHVDAGGGKTHIILADVFRQMGRLFQDKKLGGKRRPLLMCPNNLIKNYVEDTIFMTQGKVNIIVVNTKTMNQYGEEKLAEMIEKAPVNTLVISEFDFMRNKPVNFAYGNTTVDMSLNCEFMRQFDWIYVSGDESHLLKNTGSKRSSFVGRLTADIDKRRIATGTFIHGMLQDAAGQFAQLDPTVFGSQKAFIEEYAAEVDRGKVVRWHDDAVPKVSEKVREHSNFIRISRKEWAALLPPATEEFHRLDLSRAQRDVYQSLLEKAIEEIKNNPQLMAKLKAGNEEDSAAIEMMLRPYLQRLEKFLAAPDTDELGETLLQGDDLVSPKAKKVIEILRNHESGYTDLSGNEHGAQSGKVLIFTSYIKSAESIYNALPPEIKEKTMLYYAADGVKATKRFERDNNYRYLIGTEMSLNTGHNFQFVNRLIRIENIWNPGDLEQAASRLNRPDPKQLFEKRTNIFFDWLICDGTIDVTKCGRLISKLLDTTRFNEENNPLYADIPNLELVSMTLNSILEDNEFGSADEPGSLWEYLEAYQDVARARKQDYANWATAYKGPTEPVPVPSAGMLPGSALMDVPYIDNMQLPYTQELGIIPLNDYLSDAGLEVENLDMKGMRVHTEYGDGIVTSGSKHRVNVELDIGGKVSVSKLATFIIESSDTRPVKERLAEILELGVVSIDPFDVDEEDVEETQDEAIDETDDGAEDDKGETPPPPLKAPSKPKRAPKSDNVQNFKMNCSVYVLNNMIAVSFDDSEPDIVELGSSKLKKLGFRHTGGYIDAYIPTYRAMTRFIDALEGKYDVKPRYMEALYNLQETFKEGKRRLLNVNAATKVEMRQFHADKRRPVPKGELRPYPIVNEGDLYITFSLEKQPSAKAVNRSIKVPTVRWERNPDGEWVFLANKKKDVKELFKAIQKEGIEIPNLDDALEELGEVKLLKPKKETKPKPRKK